MQPFAYISQAFNSNLSSSYTLSIQCDLNGLSFSVINSDEQCLLLKTIPLDSSLSTTAWENLLDKSIEKENILIGSWKQVRVIWTSRKSLIIPASLFRKDDLKSYLVLHQMLDEYDEIHHIRLQKPDSWLVFPVPSAVTQIFIRHFPGALFYHQAVPFLSSIQGRNRQFKGDGLHLSLHQGFFDYAVVRNDELHSFNSFTWKDANDILYLVVYLFKQFDFSSKQQELVLYGVSEDQMDITRLLQKYIHTLRLALPDERLRVNTIAELNHPCFYTNLLNIYFCES